MILIHESVKSITRGSSLTKSEQSLFNDVFFPLFKICEKGEEEGQNWENSKTCTFWITHTNFKHRRWIFKIYFAWINFREKPKTRNLIHAKFNPRKVALSSFQSFILRLKIYGLMCHLVTICKLQTKIPELTGA